MAYRNFPFRGCFKPGCQKGQGFSLTSFESAKTPKAPDHYCQDSSAHGTVYYEFLLLLKFYLPLEGGVGVSGKRACRVGSNRPKRIGPARRTYRDSGEIIC